MHIPIYMYLPADIALVTMNEAYICKYIYIYIHILVYIYIKIL